MGESYRVSESERASERARGLRTEEQRASQHVCQTSSSSLCARVCESPSCGTSRLHSGWVGATERGGEESLVGWREGGGDIERETACLGSLSTQVFTLSANV